MPGVDSRTAFPASHPESHRSLIGQKNQVMLHQTTSYARIILNQNVSKIVEKLLNPLISYFCTCKLTHYFPEQKQIRYIFNVIDTSSNVQTSHKRVSNVKIYS